MPVVGLCARLTVPIAASCCVLAAFAQAPGPRPLDPSTVGRLSGRAVFRGSPPPRDVLSMSADPVCVGRAGATVPSQAVLVDPQGGLQNVFVYIKYGLDPARTFDVPDTPVVLDQVRCQYSPRVLGVRVGQPFEILNGDPALHNTHARPVANKEFNIGQPIQGMRYRVTFTSPEVMVPLASDIKRWMVAFVGVVEHPFFAVSAADGSFEIGGLPPGTYTIEAWHERFGRTTKEFTVGAGQTASVTLTFENQ